MSATGAGYDYSVSTFSPNGRVFQVEYAAKAVEKSGTALGVRCKDGVVLGCEKSIMSKMLLASSNRRIHTVDLHAGLALSGLAADARQLVNKARSEAQEYRSFYGSEIPGKVLNDRLAGHVHNHTLYWHSRPYGCSVLLATYDEGNGPQLYGIEPSGVSYRYFAVAIGKYKQGSSSELEKLDFTKLTVKEAVNHVARIIYKLHDEVKDKELELELSWVCDESNRLHVPVPDPYRSEAIRLAQEAKKREEMDSDDEEEEEKKQQRQQ
jgi:20S proteasome subunit alpha 7